MPTGARRKHQVAFSGADQGGALCEHCPSPNFSHSEKRSSCAAATLVRGAAALSAGTYRHLPDESEKLSNIWEIMLR
jgi:hypothetical protein